MAMTAADRARDGAAGDTELPVPAAPAPERAATGGLLRDPSAWATALSVLIALIPLTHARAGLDPWAVPAALLLLVPALAVVRPWRDLGPAHLLALAPAAAALLVCLTAPTGFDGVDEIASYSYAGLLYLLVAGFVRRGGPDGRAARTVLPALCLLVAALDQAVAGWWPWSGGQDSGVLMVGTFYWHNQFSAFAGAAGLFGLVLALRADRWLQRLGVVVAVVAVPMLMLSASRGGLLTYAAGWIVVAGLTTFAAVTSTAPPVRRWRGLVALAVLPALGLALTAFLAGPVLMSSSGTVSDNIEGRQSLGGNTAARVEYVKAAARLAADRPLTGAGFDSFHGAATPILPATAQATTDVHNGYAQAFSDGGLVLGAAVPAATLAPFVLVARRLRQRRHVAAGEGPVPAVGLAALVALGALALHSAMDFDWTYPALLALYAVLAGLVVGAFGPSDETGTGAGEQDPRPRGPIVMAVAVLAVLLVALPASARSGIVNGPGVDAPGWSRVATAGLDVSDVPRWARGAHECRQRLLAELEVPGRTADPAVLDEQLDCTAAAAEQSPSLVLIRARAQTRLGRGDEVAAEVAATVARHGTRIPALVVAEAALPHDAGDDAAAAEALTAALTDPRVVADQTLVRYATSLRDSWQTSG